MYKKKLTFKNHEIPAKIDGETGEVTEMGGRPKGDPRNQTRVHFSNPAVFQRKYKKAWELLDSLTNDSEYVVALKLSDLSKSFSASLEPLNDETSVREISRILKRDRRSVSKILKRLFDLGVYGKFAVTDANYDMQRYWMFNPYLSFNGTHIEESTLRLFENTRFSPKLLED